MERPELVLIVDDDREIRDLLVDYLQRNGYRAAAVPDGAHMWQALQQRKVDLVILDLMLPGEDGLEICRRLRAESSLPVVMLTARGEEIDRIVGLEMGADDYLPKPFNPRELLARIKGVLRRTHALPPDSAQRRARNYRFAGWTLDTTARHLVSPEGVVVSLSAAEYSLLEALLRHPHHILSRDQLLDLVRGRDAIPFDRSIDMQISRLRKRLGDRGGKLIQTARGQGYVLAVKVEHGP